MNKIVKIFACLAILLIPSLAIIPPAVIASTIETVYSEFVKHDVVDDAELAGSIPLGGLAILVIDQQVSFHPGGSLAIPTANEDAARIAAFITNHTSELSQIILTMDSHQRYHIAHGIFWMNDAGESPQPFTTITSKDIKKGVWRPRDSSLSDYVLTYTKALEATGKFSLTIWPEHCLIGSPGHNIVPNVLAAPMEWTKRTLKPIQYVMKGSNPFTEHYSVLKAEYELPYDPSTSLNKKLIKSLQRANKVVIVGEALSHCVNYTIRDLVAAWPKKRLSDLFILTDCSSPVPGFEEPAKQFLRDMAARGVTLTTSTEYFLGKYARSMLPSTFTDKRRLVGLLSEDHFVSITQFNARHRTKTWGNSNLVNLTKQKKFTVIIEYWLQAERQQSLFFDSCTQSNSFRFYREKLQVGTHFNVRGCVVHADLESQHR